MLDRMFGTGIGAKNSSFPPKGPTCSELRPPHEGCYAKIDHAIHDQTNEDDIQGRSSGRVVAVGIERATLLFTAIRVR